MLLNVPDVLAVGLKREHADGSRVVKSQTLGDDEVEHRCSSITASSRRAGTTHGDGEWTDHRIWPSLQALRNLRIETDFGVQMCVSRPRCR